MPFFHLNSTDLAVGSVIQPGNWGRIILRVGPNHNRWLPEAALEHVRETEFSHLPSRMRSCYFFDSFDECNFYRGQHAHVSMMYRVEVLEPDAPQHITDYRQNQPTADFSLDWCRGYWRGALLPSDVPGIAFREILAETPLRIVEVIGG